MAFHHRRLGLNLTTRRLFVISSVCVGVKTTRLSQAFSALLGHPSSSGPSWHCTQAR